jgi:hypothetical protein
MLTHKAAVSVDLAQFRIDQHRRSRRLAADEIGLTSTGDNLLEDHFPRP